MHTILSIGEATKPETLLVLSLSVEGQSAALSLRVIGTMDQIFKFCTNVNTISELRGLKLVVGTKDFFIIYTEVNFAYSTARKLRLLTVT